MADNEDPIAARRNALASVVRSFAWPFVALIAMYNFSGTLDGLVRSAQKVSFAGLAVETFKTQNTLTNEQVEKLKTFSASEIIDFISYYRPGSRNCIDTKQDSMRPQDKSLLEAGLIQIGDGDCANLKKYVQLTVDGARLREAITNLIGGSIQETLH